MKRNYTKLLIILLAAFIINGCYTVIWTPDEEFPTESTTNEYYSETYYGDYYSFYDYPWWLSFVPPSLPVGSDYKRTDNESTSSTRNEGQGRGNTDSRDKPGLNTPTRDASNNSSNNNSNSSSSSNNNSTVKSSNDSSSSRSSDNNSIRNNDGSRNTNSGRR